MREEGKSSNLLVLKMARSLSQLRIPNWYSDFSIQSIMASIGLVGVAWAESIGQGPIQSVLADVGFIGLFAASALLLIMRRSAFRGKTEVIDLPQAASWKWTILGLGLAGAIVVQVWFKSGYAFAVGDTTPPIGTAWLARVFSSFAWNGVSLGAPTNNQVWLPWAFVDWMTHLLGGSGALAQRIWFSVLVAAVLVAAGMLARSLRFSRTAGVVVALLYFFNPMTMSVAGTNTVFLMAMVLVPVFAALVISYGTGHIKLWQFYAAFVVAAPFVGYVYNNPPLLIMLALTTCGTPLVILARFGRSSAVRSIWALLIGGTLLIGVSGYWLIPSITALSTAAVGSISSLSTWGFSETRSTLTNGFWLNTTWAWLPMYFPPALDFGNFPLDLVRLLLPLFAFCGLVFRRVASDMEYRLVHLRGTLSMMILFVIFLSTGTRPPGNLLFNPLYNLPFGWLLREPGRFLVAAALGYALVSGLLVQQLQNRSIADRFKVLTRFGPRVSRMPQSAFVAVLILFVGLASSFPLWTGSIFPGPRQGFPSTLVKVPAYWETTARFLNTDYSPKGALLVLPPDDYYQMPYDWYYGNDGFISNLISRHVVDPNAQTYYAASEELLSAVKLEAAAITGHNWLEAGRLLTAIGTPLVLVRGDIKSNLQGRNIVSPSALAIGLAKDPEMKFIYHNGLLSIYRLKAAYLQPPTNFATIDTATPDLRILSQVPRRTAVVTSAPQQGHIALFTTSILTKGKITSSAITSKIVLSSGWTYSLKSLAASVPQYAKMTLSKPNIQNKMTALIKISLGRSLISNGNFSAGVWGGLSNCYNHLPVKPTDVFSAGTIKGVAPDKLASLELKASVDSACETQTLAWHGGPFLLRLWERSLKGSPPRLCVWQVPGGCAALPPMSASPGWHRYSAIVNPSTSVKSITIYLYADAAGNGLPSVEQYAGVVARSTGAWTSPVIVGIPLTKGIPDHITTIGAGYSLNWADGPGAKHVLVDGLRNGWITKPNIASDIVPYDKATSHNTLEEVFLFVFMMLLAGMLRWMEIRRRKLCHMT